MWIFFLGGVNLVFCAINTLIHVLLTTYTVFSSKSFNSWIGVFLFTLVLSSLSLKIETNNLTKVYYIFIDTVCISSSNDFKIHIQIVHHVHIYLKEIWMWKSLSYLGYILCKAWYFLECQECLDVNICKKTVSSRYTVDIQLCTFKFSTSYTPFIHVQVHCTININEILLKLIDNF